ncbi:hypothetical protein [Helicobacter sp. MIT 14-3879]|uniref:hypothetical protein n=1 Tax=Helicobacter sp. MIT 14-3879 TaxID=2040649 RepID=UPI000E1F7191|nr:hypothetical protein [Helicobacter sp. MIT 14-3879]RDU64156.1 hypothetical protein CQA44_04320 [Helicobacter sp. MIT 14-3879]
MSKKVLKNDVAKKSNFSNDKITSKKIVYILSKAKRAFLNQQYDIAMNLYNEVIINNTDSKEAKIGILLCDIASDNEEQAQKIFEYYQILKAQKIKDSADNILNIINLLDKNTNSFAAFINDFEEAKINDIDGILYSDFKKLITSSNDFKKMFEYAMFSTRIVFTKKGDFIEFLELLIENDLSDISIKYIETLDKEIIYDSKIQSILKKALDKVNAKEIIDDNKPRR